MSWLETVSLIFGIIGILFGLAVGVRGRQLSRPNLVLHLGFITPPYIPRKLRRLTKRPLFYGVQPKSRNYVIVPCYYLLENTSNLPISNVTLRLEYPRECLLDDSVIVDNESSIVAFFRSSETLERTVQKFRTYVSVTYDVEILRPRERLVIPDVVKLPVGRVAKAEDDETTVTRFASVDGFCSAATIQASVWSANCAPLAVDLPVFAMRAATLSELYKCFARIAVAVWDDHRPRPGIYWMHFWRRRRWWYVRELCELVLLEEDVLGASLPKGAVDPAIAVDADRMLAYLDLPPWGFFGTSFDIGQYMGFVRLPAVVQRKVSGA